MPQPVLIDDKTPLIIPFILKHLEHLRSQQQRQQQQQQHPRPLFIGLNGLQGIGKSTLVALLTTALQTHNVSALVCSIDDFYLPRAEQLALAAQNPTNALWQHRGEPGTHDLPLARNVLAALLAHKPTLIPAYDKAAFSGQGDRLPPSLWRPVNQAQPVNQTHSEEPSRYYQVLILEGWCVGFRPLTPSALLSRYHEPTRTLRHHELEHLAQINEALREYDAITDLFDAFIHIDADSLEHVYGWRLQQEEHLRRERGDPAAGMTDEEVVRFVDGYFPAYELYGEGLRGGVFPGRAGAQLRIVVDGERRVKEVIEI